MTAVSATGATELPMLTDSLGNEDLDDLLDHSAIAAALASAIRASSPRDSLGIALYASWGQGKTTIGRLLRRELSLELNDGRYAFIHIATWKYALEGDRHPLRRHYLLSAYEAIGANDKAEELRAQFTRVFSTKRPSAAVNRLARKLLGRDRETGVPYWRWVTQQLATSWRTSEDWRQHSLVVPFLFLAPLLLLAFPGVRDLLGGVVSAVAATLLIILAAGSWMLLRLLASNFVVSTQADPFRSVEEFDQQFNTFLETDAANYERFIFFIDDLDRCRDATVAEALETLQAFFDRERCVFIVAADQKQLKRAVRLKSTGPASTTLDGQHIPPDEHFLEKIFHVSIHVPPLFAENLGTYAQRLARGICFDALNDDARRVLLSYLVHPEVSSPRQVKAILNEYALTHAQIVNREQATGTNLNHQPLTEDPLFIAKMVVLRAHFPWFYDLLRVDPLMLIEWRGVTEAQAGPAATPWLAEARRALGVAAARSTRESSNYAGTGDDIELATAFESRGLVAALRGYLTRTEATRPADAVRVQEFMFLRSPSAFAGLTGAEGAAIRVSIANGDIDALAGAIDASPEQLMAAIELALEKLRTGFGIERDNARLPLAWLVGRLPETIPDQLGTTLANALFAEPRSD